MSVLIKRSTKLKSIPHECAYGCCTPVHGKDTRIVRRAVKRSERQAWRRELRDV